MSTLVHPYPIHAMSAPRFLRENAVKDPSEVIREATRHQSRELENGHHHVGEWTPPSQSASVHAWSRAAIAVAVVLGLEVGHSFVAGPHSPSVGAAPLAQVVQFAE